MGPAGLYNRPVRRSQFPVRFRAAPPRRYWLMYGFPKGIFRHPGNVPAASPDLPPHANLLAELGGVQFRCLMHYTSSSKFIIFKIDNVLSGIVKI